MLNPFAHSIEVNERDVPRQFPAKQVPSLLDKSEVRLFNTKQRRSSRATTRNWR
jgi:hypothetical protein